jgi:2-dehydro-3-deoxyphosphogluconate aldolase/(4S)-4-hydroxy-2-oxoglutarate aldolase
MSASGDAFFAGQLASSRVIGIFRGLGTERTLTLCRRAWDLGVTLVELPVQSDDDLDALAAAVALGREEGRLVGAGTVTSAQLLREVVAAGAAFSVAPGLDEQVAAAAAEIGLPHLPGVATATEVQRAVDLGFGWVKAFPAAALGPVWFTAMRGPYPQVHFVATGGVDTSNAAALLDAGASAVALGSAFADVADDVIAALVRPVGSAAAGPRGR